MMFALVFTACGGSSKKTVGVTGVTVSPSTLTLSVGQTRTLTATVLPENASNKKVIWSSSDNPVATVSQMGLVTAVAAGSATITVTTEDGNHKSACDVIVGIPVESVTASPSTLTLSVGQTQPLTAMVLPENATNKGVTWASNNPSAAVTENGLVTANAVGDAIITVTTIDGGYTDSVFVTVAIPVITVFPGEAMLTVLSTQQLTARVTPENLNAGVTWSSSNQSVATVSATGLVTAYTIGSATITATAAEGGITSQCAITVDPTVYVGGDYGLVKDGVKLDGYGASLGVFVQENNVYTTNFFQVLKNGEVLYNLEGKGEALNYNAGFFVSGEDIYVTNHDYFDNLDTARLWKNGSLQPLELDAGRASCAKGVFASGDDVYVAGYEDNGSNLREYRLWKNGQVQLFNDAPAGSNSNHDEGANQVFVSGGDVYVSGYRGMFKNGERIYPQIQNRIWCFFVVGDDLYCTGYGTVTGSAYTHWVWKNGEPLYPFTEYYTVPVSMFVYGDDIYVGGSGMLTQNSGVTAMFWVNGETRNTQGIDDLGYIDSIFVNNGGLVTGVYLKPAISVSMGEYITIIPAIIPLNANNKAVSWNNSNPAVATVSPDGLVTPITPGTTTITVTTQEGGYTASCVLTVPSNTTPVAGVTLTQPRR